jgi:hypothetical protein
LKLSTLTFTCLQVPFDLGRHIFTILTAGKHDKSCKDLKTTDENQDLTESFSSSTKRNTVCNGVYTFCFEISFFLNWVELGFELRVLNLKI